MHPKLGSRYLQSKRVLLMTKLSLNLDHQTRSLQRMVEDLCNQVYRHHQCQPTLFHLLGMDRHHPVHCHRHRLDQHCHQYRLHPSQKTLLGRSGMRPERQEHHRYRRQYLHYLRFHHHHYLIVQLDLVDMRHSSRMYHRYRHLCLGCHSIRLRQYQLAH